MHLASLFHFGPCFCSRLTTYLASVLTNIAWNPGCSKVSMLRAKAFPGKQRRAVVLHCGCLHAAHLSVGMAEAMMNLAVKVCGNSQQIPDMRL